MTLSIAAIALLLALGAEKRSSYAPVDQPPDPKQVIQKMKAAKAGIQDRQAALLKERYDLANTAAKGVTMERYSFFQQDPRGVWKSPDGAQVAWFRDPDMNLLSVVQHP